MKFFIYRYRYYIHVRKWNQHKLLNKFDTRSLRTTYTSFNFLKISCWFEDFLACMLFYTNVLGRNVQIPFGNSRAGSKIFEFTHSWAGGRSLACNQAASSDACIIDRRLCTVISILVMICVGIDKQSLTQK